MNDVSLSDWVPSSAFPDLYPQFPNKTINYLLRERDLNGLSEANAVRVIGRQRFIHVQRFAEWIENSCRRTRNRSTLSLSSDSPPDGNSHSDADTAESCTRTAQKSKSKNKISST